MEIQEVEIGTSKKRAKKISPKLIRASEKWLQNKGVDLEDLTEPQREEVYYLIKQKRGLFWYYVIVLPCILLYIGVITLFTHVIQDSDELFIPKQYAVENDAGEKVYQSVPESLHETIQLYGKVALLFGILMGGVLYSIASGIGGGIGNYFGVKRKEKTISAFLPTK